MYKLIIFLFFAILSLSSCKSSDDEVTSASSTGSSEKSILSFQFLAASNEALSLDVDGTISGTSIAVSLPSGIAITALVPTFTLSDDATIKIGDVEQVSGTTANDFSASVTYSVSAADTTSQDYAVTVTATDGTTDTTTVVVDPTLWEQQAYIKASNADTLDGNAYSYEVSLDGDTLAVGVQNEDSNQTTISNDTTSSADNSAIASGAVYIYKRTGATWEQEAYIKPTNNFAGFHFGAAVSIDGDSLAIGATSEGSNQTTITTTANLPNFYNTTGAVYLYQRSGSTWALQAFIKAANSNSFTVFGESVSLDGDTLAVGSNGEASNQTTITNGTTASSDTSLVNAGAVYIYQRTGTTWVQQAYIKASNAETQDHFGERISLSGDLLAVGSAREDSNQQTITNGATSSADNSAPSSGAVYIYSRTGSTWAQEAYIKASNSYTNYFFGINLSLSGETLAVGAPWEGSRQNTITNGTTSSTETAYLGIGAVYVYQRTGTNWEQQAYIKPGNANTAAASLVFGQSVSLAGDTLAVGVGDSSNQTSITNGVTSSDVGGSSSSGATFIYQRTGTTWEQQSYIKAVNADAVDDFGKYVSLSGDSLAVAAPFEDSSQRSITNGSTASADNSASEAGAVYIYIRK